MKETIRVFFAFFWIFRPFFYISAFFVFFKKNPDKKIRKQSKKQKQKVKAKIKQTVKNNRKENKRKRNKKFSRLENLTNKFQKS